jgi:hypothetical protein
MKITKISLFLLAWLVVLLASPLVHSKSPYAGSQGSTNTTPVHGYTKKDGTYVAPYQRTAPNGTQRDNWSSKPNVNPYTGKEGTKEPQK